MRRPWISALLFLAACGATPAPPPPIVTPPAPTAPDAHGPALLEPEADGAARIAADVKYLASDELAGRGTGDPGAIAARDFIGKRFADLGLEPAGDTHGFFQAFKARVGAKADPPELSFAPKKGASTPIEQGKAVAADGSKSDVAEGDAIFVGYGVTAEAAKWDDYAGLDLAHKIAVVIDGAPPDQPLLRDFGSVRYKLRTAREHGAYGVVLVAAGEELPAPPADATSMGVAGVVITASAAKPLLKSMGVDPDKMRKVEPDKAKAARAKPKPGHVAMKVKIEPIEADAWNVAGLLRSTKPSAEYVVVGAHYDHLGHGGTSASRAPGSHEIHHGADDNASGTALVMEVARRLAKDKDGLDRNVLFLSFSGEEIGLIGSRWFTDHPTVPLDKIDVMINADMVGRLREEKLLVDGLGTSEAWPGLVKTASTGLHFDLAFGSEGFGASDHSSFTAVKVPVAFFFTGVHEDYHRPSDTADKINAEGEERVATMVARLALSVADRPEKLAFVDAPPDPHHGMRGGFKVALGTMPDYAYQGKGLKLTGVRPDSPAARAGIQGGDIVVKLGPHEITNIHDYMFALGELEPGSPVMIEVDRAGQKLSLKIIPAPGR